MAKMREKLLSTLLGASMLLSAMPTGAAFAEDAQNPIIWEANFDGTDDTTYWGRENADNITVDNYEFYTTHGHMVDGVLTMRPNGTYGMGYGKFTVDGRMTNETSTTTETGDPVVTVEDLEDGSKKTTTVTTETTKVSSFSLKTTTKTTTEVSIEKDGETTTEEPVVNEKTTYTRVSPVKLFDTAGKENIMWETKIKWDYPESALDENGYIKYNDNALLRLNGISTDYMANLRYTNGYISYGGTQNDAAVITTERFKNNEWYTVRIYVNNVTKKMKLEFVSDDAFLDGEKHEFYGDWTNTSHGLALGDIYSIAFTRQLAAGMTTYIDYSKLVDMSLLPTPSAAYNDADLNGQKGITAGTSAEITFDYAITADDLDKITINKGAVISKVLSEDGKTVTVTFDTLAASTKYTLAVEEIGMNAAVSFSFTSAKDENDPYFVDYQFNGDEDDFSGWYKADTYDVSGEMSTRIKDGSLYGTTQTASYNRYSYKFSPALELDGRENIVIEARVKAHYAESESGANNTIKPDSRFMQWNNSLCTLKTRANADGVSCFAYGGDDNNDNVVTDFPIYNDKFYTYRATLNFKTNQFAASVWDDEGNRYDGPYVNARYNADLTTLETIYFARHNWNGTETWIDYFKVFDKDMLPQVSATYDGKDLSGASKLPYTFDAAVNFPCEITEAEMNAIQIDTENVTRTLSEDKKTVTLHFADLDAFTQYKVIVPDTDLYAGGAWQFTTKWEDKYIFRAEFDGYDDYTNMYHISYDGGKYENSQMSGADVSNGLFTGGTYRGFEMNMGKKLDMTDKDNIVVQMRFKYTGSEPIWNQFFSVLNVNESADDPRTLSSGAPVTELKIKDNVLWYHNDAVSGGEASTGYTIEKDMYYTLNVKLNFLSHKYSFTIRNDLGDIASVADTNFMYNNKSDTFGAIRAVRNYDGKWAKGSIDYIRVWDAGLGKAKVITSDGVALDRNVNIPIAGDMFTVALTTEVTATDGITLKSENGTAIECAFSQQGSNEILVIPQDNFDYDTVYTLTIPKEILGSDEDQEVTFRTVYDTTKSFTLPSALADKDSLNVVYFGGSITAQEGWRVHASNKLTELFGANNINVTNINSSVGGTGAGYGWKRLGRDVISKNPDIVFIEFAVNDSNSPTAAADMESLVRNLNSLENRPVIIFVYTTVMDFDTNTFAIAEHERIAKAYGIPTISIHDKMLTYYNADAKFKSDWDSKVYLPDGTHPNTEGSTLYGEYVNALLEHNSDKYFVLPKTNEEVAALTDCKNYYYDYAAAETVTDADKTFSFNGDSFMLTFGEPSGTYTLTVDGKTVAENVAYAKTSNGMVTYDGFGDGAHTATITATGTVNLTGIFTIHQNGVIYTMPVFDKDAVTAGEALTATAKYTAYSVKPITLIVALYDANGKLTSVESVSTITDASGVEREISATVTPASGDAKAKAFLWNGIDTMNALAQKAQLGF